MTAKIKLRSQLHLMTGFMAGFIFAFVLLLYVYDVNRASPWCTSSSTLPTATTAPWQGLRRRRPQGFSAWCSPVQRMCRVWRDMSMPLGASDAAAWCLSAVRATTR
ncbi:GL15449 [Drosophila persimilis]|uniref:GL15449 n=1 Tax=Drosophila persimilis TaxID=7234 RepID=B4HBX9_DROPE|nr:GL15449 [Drosophila persimilis]